jgi:hypothetical protein
VIYRRFLAHLATSVRSKRKVRAENEEFFHLKTLQNTEGKKKGKKREKKKNTQLKFEATSVF